MKQANDRKQKLIDLGPDALAEALLNLAVHSDEADDLIFASRLAELSCAMVRDVRESIAKAASTFKTQAMIIDAVRCSKLHLSL